MTVFEQLLLFRLPAVEPRQKTRHLLIGGRIVPYELRQSRSRLSLTIDERGLRVGAPRHVGIRDVEAFVHGHGPWVLKKLDEFTARGARRHLTLRDGAVLPLLGAEVPVQVVAGGNRFRWQPDRLVLAVRADADLDALARRALQRRALDHFRERVAHYAALLDRPPPRLALSSARTRWGSCSVRTGVRFNWRLIHLAPALIDYVVAHELAHLLEMNHSPRFWAVVEGLYPGWREARAELKRRAAELPIL
jgi:predicted metal-dependent hydrolase